MAETTKPKKAPAKPRKTTAKKKAASAEIDSAQAETMAAVADPAPAPVSREEIAKLAHQYWAERGHQHGHHVEDWLRAERELRKKAS